MKSVIKDLWYEYKQERRREDISEEKRQAFDATDTYQAKLLSTMTDEQKVLFESYTDALISAFACEEAEAFGRGVGFAVQFMLEALREQ